MLPAASRGSTLTFSSLAMFSSLFLTVCRASRGRFSNPEQRRHDWLLCTRRIASPSRSAIESTLTGNPCQSFAVCCPS